MINLSPVSVDDQALAHVKMAGTLSSDEIRDAKQALVSCVERCSQKTLEIDVSGLETVSSAAVALLLSGLRVAERQSCTLRYLNFPEYLFNMARVGGVETILTGDQGKAQGTN